jgi:ubiquinone/menaquinone biosynthesis C-methylase UbiE
MHHSVAVEVAGDFSYVVFHHPYPINAEYRLSARATQAFEACPKIIKANCTISSTMWEEYYSALSQLPDRLMKPVPFIMEALPVFRRIKASRILDLGCGAGRNSIYLAKCGFDVVGVDISRSALRKAKSRFEAEGVENIAIVCASMTHLPFINHSYDVVISVSVIHHAVKEAVGKTIGEIHRVLKDNGLFLANLLSVKDYRYGSGLKIEDGTFRVFEYFEDKQFEEVHHFFSQEEIQNLLARFKRISVEPIESGGGERSHKYWKIVAEK